MKTTSIIVVLLLAITSMSQLVYYNDVGQNVNEPSDDELENRERSEFELGTRDIDFKMTPLFLENQGQMGISAGRYYSVGAQMTVGLADGYVVYSIHPSSLDNDAYGFIYRMVFVGSNPVVPIGRDMDAGLSHFFFGNDETDHLTDIRSYREVIYHDLYDHIDLRYRINAGHLKYDLIIRPGGDPNDVQFLYDGVQGLELDPASGDLIVLSSANTVKEEAPFSYQETTEDIVKVVSSYSLRGDRLVGFDVSEYDPSLPLIIDPEIFFGTYCGSTDYDPPGDFYVDGKGNIFICGGTRSPSFPNTTGAYDTTHNGMGDVFVAKMGPDAKKLIWCTFVGTSNWDSANAMVVDPDGSVYVTGITSNSSFPTTAGAFCSTVNSYDDTFYLKLDRNGSKILFSTLFGGEGRDLPFDMVLDDQGCAYISGRTGSKDFPITSDALKSTIGGSDFYLIKINANASKVLYSTFIGGDNGDNSRMMNLIGSRLYIIGDTSSPLFPTTSGSFDTSFNGKTDGFLMVFDTKNLTINYSTFLGGKLWEIAYGLDIDDDGFVYITGRTDSTDFPVTATAFDTSHNGNYDVFVLKFDIQNSSLVYSTYIGGSQSDVNSAIQLDDSNNVYIGGSTTSVDFPVTSNAMDGRLAGSDRDGILLKLDHNGSNLIYSTYLGGTGYEDASCLQIVNSSTLYVLGITSSWDFPVTNDSYQTTHGGDQDTFIMRIWFDPPYIGDDNAPMFATTGDPFTFNVTMLAPNKVRSAIVDYWYGRSGEHKFVPLKMSSGNLTDGSWTATITVPLNSLAPLRYRYHLHDTLNDYRFSGIERVTIIDNDLPELDDESKPPATTGDPFNLSVNITDNIGIDHTHVVLWFGNDTDKLHNFTLIGMGLYGLGNGTYYHDSLTMPASSLDPLHYYFTTNDTSGNWNRTENLTMDIHDNDPPEILEDLTRSEATTGDAHDFRASVRDNFKILSAQVVYWFGNSTTSAVILAMDPESVNDVGNGTYTATIIVPLHGLQPIRYFFRIQDLSTLNETITKSVQVVDNDRPIITDVVHDDEIGSGHEMEVWADLWDNIGVGLVQLLFTFVEGGDTHQLAMECADPYGLGNGTYVGTIPIPKDFIGNLSLTIEAYDWSGNSVEFHSFFRVVDLEPPEIIPVDAPESGIKGLDLTIRVKVTDNIGLATVLFYYGLGQVQDHHMIHIGNDVYEVVYKTPREPMDGPFEIPCFILVRDTSGNQNRMDVPVLLINSPPRFLDLPRWDVNEGELAELDLVSFIEDLNDPVEDIRLNCDDDDITVSGTLLSVLFDEWIPNRIVALELTDGEDTGTANIALFIHNINDPPEILEIPHPLDGTTVIEGTEVTFEVLVWDPDMPLGDVLTVEWSSNISGTIMTLTTEGELKFTYGDLPSGTHKIALRVTDGELYANAYLSLNILPEDEPEPPPPTPEPQVDDWTWHITNTSLLIILCVIIVVLSVAVFIIKRRA